MKKFTAQFSLVLVLLLVVTSCTNDDFEEIPVFEMEDVELQDLQSNHMSDGEEDSDPKKVEQGKDD
jgi:hypothetical protein